MPDQINSSTNHIPRRAILRGAGCALALPWLESFAAKASPASSEAFPNVLELSFSAVASMRTTGGPRDLVR